VEDLINKERELYRSIDELEKMKEKVSNEILEDIRNMKEELLVDDDKEEGYYQDKRLSS
jgi:hypothetical protein